LFEAQTIEEFARVLESRRKGSESNWSPLVEIQPKGDRPIFFCVHAAGGNVLVYRDLSKRLGSDQPFYGLQSQGLDGKMPPLTRIEDMAALYVGEIQRIQPHGPYFIGGYCLGGTVALEMASQLRAQGEEVGLLALFDTLNWCRVSAASITTKVYQQGQRFTYHALNFSLLSFRDKAKFFSEKLKMLRARLTVWRGMVFGRNGQEHGSNISESSILAKIWDANDQAALEYVPRPYPGVITDFRPKTQYSRYSGTDLKWSQIALEGEQIVSLPVYPAGMLIEPFVKDLAEALSAEIEKSARKTVVPARRS
jgi:thioesterase domain-containing protein